MNVVMNIESVFFSVETTCEQQPTAPHSTRQNTIQLSSMFRWKCLLLMTNSLSSTPANGSANRSEGDQAVGVFGGHLHWLMIRQLGYGVSPAPAKLSPDFD